MSEALTRMRSALESEGVDDDRAQRLLFWARAFLSFSEHDDPRQLDRNDLERFLAHVTEERYAGRASRNRALEAIEHLFRNSDSEVPSWLKVFIAEQRSTENPNILTPDEVRRLLLHLSGRNWLAAALIYGTGIRLIECVRLRVRDIDLAANELHVRDTSGTTLRRMALPDNVHDRLHDHLEDLKLAHIRDIVVGGGSATLPPAIAAESPRLARQWGWQYLFPQRLDKQRTEWTAPSAGLAIHHVDPKTLHRTFERAAVEANIYRRVTGHVLRNSFAVHMLRLGVSMKRVERMLGIVETDGESAEARSLPIPPDAVPPALRSH
jgi:site-specific recombinase XerD